MSTRVLVTQHGARGDGRGDDADAILEAVNVAAERGATLVLPPGTYVISRAIALGAGKVHRVEGAGAVLQPAAAYVGSGLSLDDDTLGSLQLDGLGISGFKIGLSLSRLRHARLAGLRVQGCGTGIALTGGDGVEIAACQLSGNDVDLSLGTGASGLSRVHAHGNRLEGTTPIRFVRDGDAAALSGFCIGPGDKVGGVVTIPAWASYTTVLQSEVAGIQDAGASSTILGVAGVDDKVGGRALPRRKLGLSVPITAGGKALIVLFDSAEPDAQYFLGVTTSWNTVWSVYSRRADGFELRFSVSAPTTARIDWFLTR